MGVFLQVLLFPGGNELKCRTALQRAAEDPDMGLKLDGCRWHLFPKGPAVLLNDGCLGYDALTAKLSAALPAPVMELYIYDDDYWGYWLFQGGAELDSFASLPDYFQPGSPPNRPGNALLLGQVFAPARDIARYLRPWGGEEMGVPAYAGDQAAIGDSWQLADFMDALGYDFDLLCPPPAPEAAPQPRQIVSPPPAAPAAVGRGTPADAPEFSTALTSRPYALERAAEVEDIAPEAAQSVRDMQYQAALPLLTAALAAHPERGALYVLRAFCWSQLEGFSGLSRKPDIDRDMTRLLELEPDNVMALRARCPTTGTSSRYRRHVEDLTRLMALDPENADHYQVSRAYRHHWMGDDQAAKADLAAVLERGRIWTVDLTYLCQELGMTGF